MGSETTGEGMQAEEIVFGFLFVNNTYLRFSYLLFLFIRIAYLISFHEKEQATEINYLSSYKP